MTLHFFFVPARRPEPVQAELNALLARGRVVSVQREGLADGADSGWAVCVELTEPAVCPGRHAGRRCMDVPPANAPRVFPSPVWGPAC